MYANQNQYQQAPGGPDSGYFNDSQWVAQTENPEIRKGFVRKVYGILGAQLALTTVVAAPFATHVIDKEWVAENSWLMLMSMMGTLGIMCAGMCNPGMFRNYPTNYVILGTFTFFEALLVGCITTIYSTESVVLVALLTAGIVGSLTMYAMYTESDFTNMGGYLFAALIALCLTGLVCMFLPNVAMAQKIMAGCGALLFSFYIIYDTQLIMGGNHAVKFGIDDYVFAALSIYLDIINIFLDLLRLLGDQNN